MTYETRSHEVANNHIPKRSWNKTKGVTKDSIKGKWAADVLMSGFHNCSLGDVKSHQGESRRTDPSECLNANPDFPHKVGILVTVKLILREQKFYLHRNNLTVHQSRTRLDTYWPFNAATRALCTITASCAQEQVWGARGMLDNGMGDKILESGFYRPGMPQIETK
jgi:hypothetical protein